MKKAIAITTTLGTYLLAASQASADTAAVLDPCVNTTSSLNNLCLLQFNGGTVQRVINIAFILAALIALGFLIWGGIRWILSGGDKGKVEAAQKTITAALIGLVVVFLSYFLLNVVLGIFGIHTTDFQIPTIF